jgi:predicted TIM-barrel fold metal-dependent hydrolase
MMSPSTAAPAAAPVIAIEEHFMHESLTAHFPPAAKAQPPAISDRLYDLTGVRIREMDAAGIDMQVLSHQSPGSQRLAPDIAVAACRALNDALAAMIATAPDRFAGFAMIPTTATAEDAADELQRAVEELGLRGAMIHGMSAGRFVDGREFWPIFARAERLGVPVYLHPAMPDRTVTATYYAPYDESHPAFIRAAWGFGVEAGTQAVRLVLSGLFDAHPDVQIILGHLGEGIPFFLSRIDEALSRPGNAPSDFAAVFRRNFHITTSGAFSDSALRCCLEELGAGRVLFAVDWPYVKNEDGTAWLRAFDLPAADKARIFGGNAIDLLRLSVPAAAGR